MINLHVYPELSYCLHAAKGNLKQISFALVNKNQSLFYLASECNTTTWPGMWIAIANSYHTNQIICTDGIPPDGTPQRVITTLSIYTRVYIALLGVVGIILATVCLIFIIVFRKTMYEIV